ncbi:MAG TPA: PIN domain-containing protein [Thermoanaerobaculia bacterium]|nr:PIN domain-containing protein [Thermoanaerobaculia bacterium]
MRSSCGRRSRSRTSGRRLGSREAVRSSSHARIVTISERLFLEALELYSKRSDKTWGLVDCASFVVMEKEGIDEAFTNDRHFVQAGLSCLLPLS